MTCHWCGAYNPLSPHWHQESLADLLGLAALAQMATYAAHPDALAQYRPPNPRAAWGKPAGERDRLKRSGSPP